MKTAILTAIALSAVLTCCSCTSSQEPSADNNTVIGISCAVTDNNSRIGRKYSEAVIKAGGTPFLLPVRTPPPSPACWTASTPSS